jgi:hypothetical protein
MISYPSICSAQKYGLLCEVESDDDEDKELCEPFFAHCKAHSIKEIAKRKVKNYTSTYVCTSAMCDSVGAYHYKYILWGILASILKVAKIISKLNAPEMLGIHTYHLHRC